MELQKLQTKLFLIPQSIGEQNLPVSPHHNEFNIEVAKAFCDASLSKESKEECARHLLCSLALGKPSHIEKRNAVN